VAELTFKLERYESEGDFVQIAPASEIVMVVSFEVVVGTQKYPMNLCFPTFALDDVLTRLNMQSFSGMGPVKAARADGRIRSSGSSGPPTCRPPPCSARQHSR